MNKIKLLGALPPGVKRLEREVDRSPPSDTEVNNTWYYTSLLRTASWCGA
jgi:hypothetical protein